ncbi:MAG: hypothetical protein ACR2OR_14955 [Hyphomicrobiales bacterium]
MKKKTKPQVYKPSRDDEEIARDLIEAIDRFLEIRRLAKCARTGCARAKRCRRPRNCASTYRSGEQANEGQGDVSGVH